MGFILYKTKLFYLRCAGVAVYLPSRTKTCARGLFVDYVAEMVCDEKRISDWFP